MTEQEQIRKKKKRRNWGFIGIESLNEEEKEKEPDNIYLRTYDVMKYHIGKENSIRFHLLFKEITGKNPFELSTFERTYWWNVIKAILRDMRKNEILFTIITSRSVYVLQKQEELQKFNEKTDRHIKSLNELKDKAKKWVDDEKWRKVIDG